jgi:hypothetical protein
LVGEDWISEHYFTTDATKESFRAKVLERRAYWDEEAKAGRPTPRSRFVEARQRMEAELSNLAELLDPTGGTDLRDSRDPDQVAADLHERLLEILELTGHGLALDRQGALLRVSSPGITDRAPLMVVSARPVLAIEDLITRDATTLREPVQLSDDSDELKSVAKLMSALFVADHGPDLILVLAGRWALLAERERWAEGRYLAVDLQLVCERNDTKKAGEIDRALTCLSAQSIAPDADGKLWWHDTLEASVKHTVGVSKDLREGVRLSIEIVANEVVARRRDQGLRPCRPARPSRWRGNHCGSSTAFCFCCMQRRRRSWGCCRSEPASTTRGTAWTGCASWCRWSWPPPVPVPAPTCTTHSLYSSDWLTKAIPPSTPSRTTRRRSRRA